MDDFGFSQADAMDSQELSHTGSSISFPRKKARKLNLQKCDFCRKRKVKCTWSQGEPRNRESPVKCDHCERRGDECSAPTFATRKKRTRTISSASGSASLLADPSLTDRPITMQPPEQVEAERIDPAMAMSDVPTMLSHRQVKDIVTILRCHYSEYRVQLSQAQWIEKCFHENSDLPGTNELKRDAFQNVSDRMEGLSKVRTLTLDYLKSLLESNMKYPMGERMLIYQLLVDVETAYSTFTAGSDTTYSRDDPEFATRQRALAEALYQNGDDNGALTLLHRIPLSQIGRRSWTRILEISQALSSRTETILTLMGLGNDPLIVEMFRSPDTLAFPYSLLAIDEGQWIKEAEFIQKSFMWPWRRLAIQEQLRDESKEQVTAFSNSLSARLRDVFGHPLLHALMYSQDDGRTRFVAKSLQSHGELSSYFSAAFPSYAEGFTPVACAASSLGDLGVFECMVSMSGQNLCSGQLTGTTGHAFCALTIALRNKEAATAKTLLEAAAQRGVDMSDCCRWGKANIPTDSLDMRTILAEALQQPISDSEEGGEDGEDEEDEETPGNEGN